jgi:cysteine synthase A
MDILQAIGNTSIVRLRKIVPANCADIFVKLEWENPTGSMKDRMALAVITRAEEDGRLKPGDTVVEHTGGSTGASLAFVCAAKGYRLRIVTSDAFSQEKRDHMAALGAELTLVPSEGGLTTRKLIQDMIEAARKLSQQPHTYWIDQLNNQDSIAGYYSLGEEIWSQTKLEVDVFVHSAGAAASSRGVGTVLKRYKQSIQVVVVEPAESSVLLGGPAGLTRSKGLALATLLHSGSRLWWTTSCRSARTMRRTWRGGSRARRPSSRGRRPVQTSSPRFRWQSGWDQPPRWSRSWSTLA